MTINKQDLLPLNYICEIDSVLAIKQHINYYFPTNNDILYNYHKIEDIINRSISVNAFNILEYMLNTYSNYFVISGIYNMLITAIECYNVRAVKMLLTIPFDKNPNIDISAMFTISTTFHILTIYPKNKSKEFNEIVDTLINTEWILDILFNEGRYRVNIIHKVPLVVFKMIYDQKLYVDKKWVTVFFNSILYKISDENDEEEFDKLIQHKDIFKYTSNDLFVSIFMYNLATYNERYGTIGNKKPKIAYKIMQNIDITEDIIYILKRLLYYNQNDLIEAILNSYKYLYIIITANNNECLLHTYINQQVKQILNINTDDELTNVINII